MRVSPSLLSLSLLSLVGIASAGSSCIAFDASWNLLAFGFNGKDYSAGTQSNWASGTAQDITVAGRPPFDGTIVNCFLSQFANAIYILGADNSNPSAIYIYNANAKSWSKQAVNTQGFDPSSFLAILDHDTDVFYALSKGELFSLDMGLLTSAKPASLSWNDVQTPGFGADYQPVMALALNHVHFLDVAGVPAGSAKIFVIHYSYLQPEPQSYGDLPATHGQTTSFFKEGSVQMEFAFIPDDGSATYVINVQTNTTKTLPGPSVKDSLAVYFASTDALVQLSSSGKVSYIPYDKSLAATAAWNAVGALPIATPTTSNPSTSSGTKTSKVAASTSGSHTQSPKPNDAIAIQPRIIGGGAFLFGLAASFLIQV